MRRGRRDSIDVVLTLTFNRDSPFLVRKKPVTEKRNRSNLPRVKEVFLTTTVYKEGERVRLVH